MISPWELQRRADIATSRAAFEARPDFDELITTAKSQGYRRITENEQIFGGVDAFMYRGGVWVELESELNHA